MQKVKITSNTVLDIYKNLINDEDVNRKILDINAPEEWQGKTIQDILNVEYYTFNHKPEDSDAIIAKLIREGNSPNSLLALNRAFCLVALDGVDRVFSVENDIVSVSVSVEYWIQSSKVSLLEEMIEDLTLATNGVKIPVNINGVERRVLVIPSSLSVDELQDTTEFGEMSICGLTLDMVFQPNIVGRSDYKVEFFMENNSGGEWVNVPINSISFPTTMNSKSVPFMNKTRQTGNVNLSRSKTIVLAFEGYINKFIDNLVAQSMASDYSFDNEELEDFDNNEQVIVKITRSNKTTLHNCIIKDHTIQVKEDGLGNETHSLTLSSRGKVNGIA